MYDIGIDVGGTGITAGLVDDECRLTAGKTIATDRELTAGAMAGVLLGLIAYGGEEKLLRLLLLFFAVSCAMAGCVLALGLLFTRCKELKGANNG